MENMPLMRIKTRMTRNSIGNIKVQVIKLKGYTSTSIPILVLQLSNRLRLRWRKSVKKVRLSPMSPFSIFPVNTFPLFRGFPLHLKNAHYQIPCCPLDYLFYAACLNGVSALDKEQPFSKFR